MNSMRYHITLLSINQQRFRDLHISLALLDLSSLLPPSSASDSELARCLSCLTSCG